MKLIKEFPRTLLWGIFIIALLTVDTGEIPEKTLSLIPHLDKAVHFALFFIFTFILAYEMEQSTLMIPLFLITATAAISASAFGAVMECVQLLPWINRSGSLWDIFANTAGAASAALLFNRIKKMIIRDEDDEIKNTGT